MRPNLSLESIAGALAVLGTGVIMAACGGEVEPPKTPVNATEVSGATDKAGDPTAKKPDAPAVETKPADPAPAAKPADPTPAAATPADTKPATETKTDTKTPAPATTTKKPGAAPAAPKKGGAGSCGAGTCSAKK